MVESVLPGDLSEAAHNSSDSGVLTRDRILETALEIIDHNGVGGLSMHRLGKALERNPMALYRHAPNKAALLDGVAEKILEQLVVDTDDRYWTSQLRSVARSYRRLALTHPHAVLLLVTRPLATPLGKRPLGTLRPLEDTLKRLDGSGFTANNACMSTGHCSVSSTAMYWIKCRNSSNSPMKRTMRFGSASIDYRSANFPWSVCRKPAGNVHRQHHPRLVRVGTRRQRHLDRHRIPRRHLRPRCAFAIYRKKIN